MLDFKRLTVLHAVGREGSMSRAATALSFTPSAVSQQINALERQTGAVLLERTPRGVRLTDAGRLLADHAQAVLDRLRRAETELTELLELKTGRLRLASFASAGARLMPEAIAAFRQAHPDIELSLEIREPAECAEMLRGGQLDGAVVFDYDFTDVMEVGELRRIPLCSDHIRVALSRRHALAGAEVVQAGDLSAEPWIQDSGTVCRELLTRMSTLAGFVPHVAFSSEDYLAVSRLVAAEVGVALIPGLASDQMADGVVLKALHPGMCRDVSFLTPAGPSPAAEAMCAVLVEQQASLPAK